MFTATRKNDRRDYLAGSTPTGAPNRQGITLLFVVSIIVLFLLMGTTFVVVSNDYLRGAVRRSRAETNQSVAVSREAGSALVERVFHEIARGPSLDATNSPLRGHDLLGDQYGYGHSARIAVESTGVTPVSVAPGPHASGQFITFDVRLGTGAGPLNVAATSLLTGARVPSLLTHDAGLGAAPDVPPGHFNGRLITVTSGAYRGLTVRVIASSVATGGTLGNEVHNFVALPISAGFSFGGIASLEEAEIVINGRPFTGSGAGLFDETDDIGTAALDVQATLPSRRGQSRAALVNDYLQMTPIGGGGNIPNSGATNEPWDAPDMQNMFLAKFRDDNDDNDFEDAGEIEPSFFRGDISGSWEGHRAAVEANAAFPTDEDKWYELFRRISIERTEFRSFQYFPSTVDPAITAYPTTAAAFAAVVPTILTDSVAVDNDNDGIADSIWMDAGYPVQSTPDGGYVKPLVSYLVLDMDGRLNLNAHDLSPALAVSSNASLLAGGGGTAVPGMGLGPAEISLAPVLSTTADAAVATRYSNDAQPGTLDELGSRTRYGWTGYPASNTRGGFFNTEIDLHGSFVTGFLNNGGVTLAAFMPSLVPDGALVTDVIAQDVDQSPYQVNLNAAYSGSDDLYSPSDLERVLRPNDRDSFLLSDRLEELLAADLSAAGGDAIRKLLTTSSFEVPSIPADLNKRLYDALPVALTEIQKAAVMAQLLPPEIRRGLPLNLNRWFGNGVDNNSNGVIDDGWFPNGLDDDSDGNIDEADEMGEREIAVKGVDVNVNVELDVDGDGTADSVEADAGYFARRNFARRLYVMMILLTEREDRNGDGIINLSDFYDYDGDGTPAVADLLAHRKMLAQWCINVVDFRDQDSIMTPMEFDLNPFNDAGVVPGELFPSTWDVDDDFATTATSGTPDPAGAQHFSVWGTERPELLITETIALHDRRTQDLDTDPSGDKTDDPPPNNDEDFDSALAPNASAFFELYNPWRSRETADQTPDELKGIGAGIDLQRTSFNVPVWRLIVVDPIDTSGATPVDFRNDADVEDQVATSATAVTRYVYFVQPGGNLPAAERTGPAVYYPPAALARTVVAEGQYAVVGSTGKVTGTTEYTTYLGRTTSDAASAAPSELDQTQRIVMDPSTDSVEYYLGTSTTETPTTRNAVIFPIGDNPTYPNRSLGISDPVNGYETLPNVALSPIADGFKFVDASNADIIIDEPVDQSKAGAAWPDHPVNGDGLLQNYRVVYLQRLANPLVPYNVDSNPYRIVDSHGVDLFAFNGIDTTTDPQLAANPNSALYDNTLLDTFERGEDTSITSGNNDAVMLWNTLVERPQDPLVSTAQAAGHQLGYQLRNTLGGLNVFYSANVGTNPFPWLAWNNRPFVNQYELANVPYTSAHWLTRVYSVSGATAVNAYVAREHNLGVEGDEGMASTLSPKLKEVYHPNAAEFPHLLNFKADAAASDYLQQLFEFAEVPSRFAGTAEYVNPATTALQGTAAITEFGYSFQAPFDELSTHRYPGKVNVNTIPSQRVWNALLGSAGAAAGPYATAATGVDFAEWRAVIDDNPVRPASAANLVSTGMTVRGPADTGLLRSDVVAGRAAGATGTPLVDFTSPAAFNNTNRNPYFRNGIRTRLGNLATNRSSVFAVWVTVGYFECDPGGNLTDFYTSGLEYGFDEGTVKRNRGFFIFDRSIPMAYEPGQNHNIEDGVLLKSIIE